MTQKSGTKVAVVTGGSRGIGKAIALALGRAGATVYVTGRTAEPDESGLPGTVGETATQVDRLGGHGSAVKLDHGDDAQTSALFDRIMAEHGRLNLLVNNATAFGDTATGYPPMGVSCWELPLELWDQLHRVGLRSHYIASVLAVPIMLAGQDGLIANISSIGAVQYVYGVRAARPKPDSTS
jgi:NAD(P)-dependent dehydrogenase (short-subunit alcohol dehydrogenase family)